MPAHKNQHFVPRAYLAPFSVGGAGAAISLLNIRSGRLIPNAPLRNQCARDYLYSPESDLRLEKMMQSLEGEYANVLRKLDDPRASATGEAAELLSLFTFIQHLRTDQAMRARKEMEEQMYTASCDGVMEEEAPEPVHRKLSDREFMLDTLRTGMLNSSFIHDLKRCVVDNESTADFLTSDDPAILTNRFLKQKYGHSNFGYGSSGAMFILPLTPRRLFMMYDGGVYTIPDKYKGRLRTRKIDSVQSFNELQFIRAAENIYFSGWHNGVHIAERLQFSKSQRRPSWATVRVLVEDTRSDGTRRYRQPRSDHEREHAKTKIIHLAAEYPTSKTWATEVKIRNPVRTFSNGTAIGMVRQREWLKSETHHEMHQDAHEKIILEKPAFLKIKGAGG